MCATWSPGTWSTRIIRACSKSIFSKSIPSTTSAKMLSRRKGRWLSNTNTCRFFLSSLSSCNRSGHTVKVRIAENENRTEQRTHNTASAFSVQQNTQQIRTNIANRKF